MPPTVIVSLDCEGKWGMADRLRPYHHRLLTSARLADAYRDLLAMFDSFEIPATFAFVMAFTLSDSESKRFDPLQRRPDKRDSWLEPYWNSVESGLAEGWHEPEPFDLVAQSGGHEIAAHGFCHRPLGDASISPAGADEELGLAAAVAKLKGVKLSTLVFPRNEVGHLRVVRSAGYVGYRARLDRRAGRIGALMDEFRIHEAPQPVVGPDEGLTAIPSGRFFNWRFGLRRVVPPVVTRARWRNQFRECARSGGVVHLWLHPHNLITGPGTAPLLNGVLRELAALRDKGLVSVMTQRDYCQRLVGDKRMSETAC